MRNAEQSRLAEAGKGTPWRKWGPYLSERQWGTVREDYSEHGDAWNYFPHDHARSRAYRSGEDGLTLSFRLAQNQKSVLALGMATRNIGAALAPLFGVAEVDQRAIVMVAAGSPCRRSLRCSRPFGSLAALRQMNGEHRRPFAP